MEDHSQRSRLITVIVWCICDQACSKSIDDDAESSSKRTCRRGCDSNNSEGMEVECIGGIIYTLSLHRYYTWSYLALCYVIISHSLLLPSSLRQMSLYMNGCWIFSPQNETDYLICCALRDDRNRSNSFDRMIRNGCFDAVMLSDSSFDSTMMWDAGSSHHSEEAFQDFGMHKPWLYLSNSLFVNTTYLFLRRLCLC